MKRGRCDVCGAEVGITKADTVVKHGKHRAANGQLEGSWCPGSNKPPTAPWTTQ